MRILQETEQEFKNMMDSCLEYVNGEGQIKRVEFDTKTREVKFVFELIEIDGQLGFIGY